MRKEWKGTGAYLRFPIQTDVRGVKVKIYAENEKKAELFIDLARERIDYWANFFIGYSEKERNVSAEIEEDGSRLQNAIELTEEKTANGWKTPVFHFGNEAGYLGDIHKIEKKKMWEMTYISNPFGLEDQNKLEETVCGDSLFSLEKNDMSFPTKAITNEVADKSFLYENEETGLTGDISRIYHFFTDGIDIITGKSKSITDKRGICRQVYGMPFRLIKSEEGNRLIPAEGLEKLRVWKREWNKAFSFQEKLAFRILPAKWPNIRVEETDGGSGEISAEAFEIHFSICETAAARIKVNAAGISFVWDREKGMIFSSGYSIAAGKDRLEAIVYSDTCCGEILCCGQAVFLLKNCAENEKFKEVDNEISGNLEKCRLMEKKIPYISVETEKGEQIRAGITAYGIRRGTYPEEMKNFIRSKLPDEKIIYKSEHYTIYENHVSDENYGKPDAWAITSAQVYSPVRVTEEFAWRDTPWGDMVRAVDRGEYWRPDSKVFTYPLLHTPYPVLDAAYLIAVDTFVKCKSGRFALEGQAGLWSAGLFQGEKEGFGVWLRDSAHIALRGGSLLDSGAAEKTLLYSIHNGFDNGSDGCAMAACGIWDYYAVTGESKVIYEAWGKLVENMEEADRIYVEEEALVRAEQSTSNDSLEEPENNGYSLGTECYYMLAYDDMYKMGKIVGESEQLISHWKERAGKMRASIRQKYWNEKYGYFTSGPVGSTAYEKGLWETSGEEAAIWPRFGIATREQRKSVLRNLEKTAMCEYGIRLFPHKDKLNHFCGSVWTVWEAGFAAAASECGDENLIWKLIAQQIRNCIINKTFYEVIDAENGKAWRWPGQLWHAAGFLSMLLLGVLGMEYEEDGIIFQPCIPEALDHLSLEDFRYRKMVLTIETEGTGSGFSTYLDGKECKRVPGNLEGHHAIFIKK